MSGRRHILLVVGVVLALFSQLACFGPALVLCQEAGGPPVVEVAISGCCGGASPEARPGTPAPGLLPVDDCGACADVALVLSAREEQGRASDLAPDLAPGLASPPPALSALAPPAIGRGQGARHNAGPLPFVLTVLSTVVLRC